MELGDSEVGLIFGYDYYKNGRKTVKPSVRVVLTHDSFMRMMEFWEARAKFLRRVYANQMPNANSGDAGEYKAALDELFPSRSEKDVVNDDLWQKGVEDWPEEPAFDVMHLGVSVFERVLK